MTAKSKQLQWHKNGTKVARELAAKKQLMLYDTSVGEHLLFATTGIPRDYQLIFLEKIRRFWQKEAGDLFIWKGITIDVTLQVGICRFDGLAGYNRLQASVPQMKSLPNGQLRFDRVVRSMQGRSQSHRR